MSALTNLEYTILGVFWLLIGFDKVNDKLLSYLHSNISFIFSVVL